MRLTRDILSKKHLGDHYWSRRGLLSSSTSETENPEWKNCNGSAFESYQMRQYCRLVPARVGRIFRSVWTAHHTYVCCMYRYGKPNRLALSGCHGCALGSKEQEPCLPVSNTGSPDIDDQMDSSKGSMHHVVIPTNYVAYSTVNISPDRRKATCRSTLHPRVHTNRIRSGPRNFLVRLLTSLLLSFAFACVPTHIPHLVRQDGHCTVCSAYQVRRLLPPRLSTCTFNSHWATRSHLSNSVIFAYKPRSSRP